MFLGEVKGRGGEGEWRFQTGPKFIDYCIEKNKGIDIIGNKVRFGILKCRI
jgi:hypothetical protein